MAEVFTDANFKEEVLEADKPVLVDFWATWCGPCQMQGPIVEELANEVSDVKIGKLDVDENPDTAGAFNVMSIPTIILFDKGQEVKKAVGVQTKESLLEMIGK